MTVLRTNYVATGDSQTAAEMDLTNTQVNSNTTDLTTLMLNAISKTTTYTAVASDFVVCDATSAGFTVTLPNNPPHRTRAHVYKIDATANNVTVACAGSDCNRRIHWARQR
jgi:hypothetical protein